ESRSSAEMISDEVGWARFIIVRATDSATASAAVSACQPRWVKRDEAKTNSRRRSGSAAKYAPRTALLIGGPLPAELTAHLPAGKPIHNLRQAFAVAKPTPPGRPTNHHRNFQARVR